MTKVRVRWTEDGSTIIICCFLGLFVAVVVFVTGCSKPGQGHFSWDLNAGKVKTMKSGSGAKLELTGQNSEDNSGYYLILRLLNKDTGEILSELVSDSKLYL